MVNLIIKPSSIAGRITAPPSKSHTQRALMFAALAEGHSVIENPLISPDTLCMMTALEQLGAKIHIQESSIQVEGFAAKPHCADDVIHAGNSGQVLRFISALAALSSHYTVITGDNSIRHRRPMQALLSGLTQLGGFAVSTKNDDYAPVIIKGPIRPGWCQISGVDSQPISALLMICPFLSDTTSLQVTEPGETPWIDLTLNWLKRFNIAVSNHEYRSYTIQGQAKIDGFQYRVPGDFSSIAFPLVAALLGKNHLVIDGMDFSDCQGDKHVIEILQSMGANIEIDSDQLIIHPCESLQGRTIDINHCIDALPILAVVGCFAKGETRLINAGIARHKESDRLSAITQELSKMGANITASDECLLIKRKPLRGANCDAHHDHRIAMALSIAALFATGDTRISAVDCISKSYPAYVDTLAVLGATCEITE